MHRRRHSFTRGDWQDFAFSEQDLAARPRGPVCQKVADPGNVMNT